MRVVHRNRLGERIVELDLGDGHGTVGDLVGALVGSASPGEEGLVLDGRWLTLDTPLSSATICEGSVLATASNPGGPTPTARTLAVIGGVRAGVAHPLVPGATVSVGRSPATDVVIADPTISSRHLTVRDDHICDHGSRNGTAIDGRRLEAGTAAQLPVGGVVRLGASRIAIRSSVDDRPVAVATGLGAVGGAIPFNRPPRAAPPTGAPVVVVPAEPPDPAAPEPLSVAGIVLPVVAGGVVALLMSPFFAVFAALGPLVTIGTWWERRRRARRATRRAREQLADDLGRLRAELPDRRLAEITRRRLLLPDPAEVVRRAVGPSVRCWERRPSDPDAFRVGVGAADEWFVPNVETAGGEPVAAGVGELVAALPAMPDVPIELDLSPGNLVGVVGDRDVAAAIGRSLLLQVATHHGPADVALVVAADDPVRWSWSTWLPHATDPMGGGRGIALVSTHEAATVDGLIAATAERALFALIEGADPLQGRATSGRRLLSHERTAALVLVADSHRLPAGCRTLVRVDGFGRIEVVDPRRCGRGRAGLAWGIDETVAERAARRLARLDDPELPLPSAGVPTSAPLLGLLGVSADDPSEIERAWRRTRGTAELVVPIGVDAEGPVMLDLVTDGPHLLVGGTTGSGKSELLRSLVAGAAARADPDHVAMVLVDYKGGAAFDCCADLPHVAGLVTDLDEDLAARALRCLDAELRHRERRLREAGAEDLAAFRSRAIEDATAGDPLPRLLVVVDEFASLAADLPDFLDALVGVAQRGRSLGVHLILATQRPAGVVTDDIRANAPCRIALRVTDPHDSVDVIGAADAASIPRSRPGRAVARFGPGELVAFQSAFVTGHSDGERSVRIDDDRASPDRCAGPTDLRRLVDTIRTTHRRSGGRRPRSPWPPPLPERVTAGELGSPDGWLLVDDPDHQRQSIDTWTPGDGHLVVVGGPGAGATSTLTTAALAALGRGGDTAPHLHALDCDAGALTSLASLPHVGTVVGPTDKERRVRLLRWLDAEVERRRRGTDPPRAPILLVIDDFGGLTRAHDPVRDPEVHDRVDRVWADGPSVGVTVVMSVRRAADLPPAFAASAGSILLHRSTDPADAFRVGTTSSTAGFPAGRVLRVGDGAVCQVVLPDDLDAARRQLASVPPPSVSPHVVGVLGPVIAAESVGAVAGIGPAGAELAIAVRDRDLGLASFSLHPGEHAMVLGPSRSGRTTALEVIARRAETSALVVGDGDLADRLAVEPVGVDELRDRLARLGSGFVLVDDCLAVADPMGVLADLVDAPPPGAHIIATARSDRFRSAYGHWATEIRRSRVGLLLRPDPIDGDLLGASLPVRLDLPPWPGRGVLVAEGRADVVQMATCDRQSQA